MKTQKSRKIRLTISLDEEVHKRVKEVSTMMGMKATTWITMMISSKVNAVDVEINQRGKGIERSGSAKILQGV